VARTVWLQGSSRFVSGGAASLKIAAAWLPAARQTVVGLGDGRWRMIDIGSRAPGFELQDHFGRKVSLDHFTGRRHVMLLFYPLDFTPT
jgi:hypothetical protein